MCGLFPTGAGFLDNFDNVRVQWYKRVQAVEALLRIDAPQSTRLLFRHLSAPDTSDETLALICYGCSSMKSIVPSKLWSQIEVLSSHESGRVRTAAFQALLRDEVAPFSTQDARKNTCVVRLPTTIVLLYVLHCVRSHIIRCLNSSR